MFEKNKAWFGIPMCHDPTTLSTCFYHFMYAVFLPILNCYKRELFTKEHRVFLVSCGQFDRQLNEIVEAGIGDLQIVSDIEILQYTEHIGGHISYFCLDSLESYFFAQHRFCVRPAAIDARLLFELSEFGAKHLFRSVDVPDVLIIDREPGENGHGGETRRISNVKDVLEHVRAHGWTAEIVYLEGKSMAEQLSLFRSARYIIAQHGSALGHLIWSYPQTGVIELVPRQFDREGWQYFELLATARGIPRIQISQRDPFEPAPIDDVIEALHRLEKMVH